MDRAGVGDPSYGELVAQVAGHSSYARRIEQRIAERTCSRREWHALRRYRSAQERGVPVLEVFSLAPAVITSDWARACRRVAPILRRYVAGTP